MEHISHFQIYPQGLLAKNIPGENGRRDTKIVDQAYSDERVACYATAETGCGIWLRRMSLSYAELNGHRSTWYHEAVNRSKLLDLKPTTMLVLAPPL